MPWLRIDDKFTRNDKFHLATKDGRALWLVAAVEVASRQGSEGFVPAHMLKSWAATAEVQPRKAAAALVASGLWHDDDTLGDCGRCRHLFRDGLEGGFCFHDWLEYNPPEATSKDPTTRMRERRRKQLMNNQALRERIVKRDRNRCRYCGIRVNWTNKVGKGGATYDHVDPDGENDFHNVVVACRKCNGEKKDRTPEEAGMPLLPVPEAVS